MTESEDKVHNKTNILKRFRLSLRKVT